MPKSEPWQELMMGRVDATIAKRTHPKAPHRDFRTRMPQSAVASILRAAELRGMSVSAYLRRAGLAFVAHDLGLDLAQLLEDEPPTRNKFDGPKKDKVMKGQGHGQWRIEGLK